MFNCEKCPSSFSSKYNLNRHKKIHDKHRVSCTVCGILFNRKDNLVRHMKTAHGKNILFYI